MWCHHGNVFAGIQPRCVRIHNKGRDAARSCIGIGFDKRDIKIGDTAIADPGLAAVEGPTFFCVRCAGCHRTCIRSRIRFAQGKSGNLFAAGHLRQISGLLRRCPGQRDRATAQALHGKCKVSQRRMKGQRFTQDNQRARIQLGQSTPKRCGHTVAQPARVAQALHPFAASGPVVCFIDVLRCGPVNQASTQHTMDVIKKRQLQVVSGRGHSIALKDGFLLG